MSVVSYISCINRTSVFTIKRTTEDKHATYNI